MTLVIRFQLSPHFEAECAGLAVVLSNALENAMHACLELPNERPRRISLEVRSTLRQLFLTITNTCHGPVELDPVTGLPCSRREGHGYGLKSIAAFAAEHGGILQCTTDSNSFCLKLLL